MTTLEQQESSTNNHLHRLTSLSPKALEYECQTQHLAVAPPNLDGSPESSAEAPELSRSPQPTLPCKDHNRVPMGEWRVGLVEEETEGMGRPMNF